MSHKIKVCLEITFNQKIDLIPRIVDFNLFKKTDNSRPKMNETLPIPLPHKSYIKATPIVSILETLFSRKRKENV